LHGADFNRYRGASGFKQYARPINVNEQWRLLASVASDRIPHGRRVLGCLEAVSASIAAPNLNKPCSVSCARPARAKRRRLPCAWSNRQNRASRRHTVAGARPAPLSDEEGRNLS
jgi:hypothetical protein